MNRTIRVLVACAVFGFAAVAAATPPRDDVPASLPGASLTVGSMTIDGQTVEAISCTGEVSILFGNPATTLAQQGHALSACVSAAARPRVHFAFTGGTVSDVRVAEAPSPAAAECIAGIVGAMHPPGSGACVATVVLTH